MSTPSAADLAATVRKGLGSGDRLVPGTISEAEFDAFAALDALLACCEEAERWEFIAAERGTRMDEIQLRAEAAEAEVERLTAVLRSIDVGFALSATEMRDRARAALAASGRET